MFHTYTIHYINVTDSSLLTRFSPHNRSFFTIFAILLLPTHIILQFPHRKFLDTVFRTSPYLRILLLGITYIFLFRKFYIFLCTPILKYRISICGEEEMTCLLSHKVIRCQLENKNNVNYLPHNLCYLPYSIFNCNSKYLMELFSNTFSQLQKLYNCT